MLFISSLLGSFFVRAAGGDYYVLSVSIVGIYGLGILVVGAQIIVYELFLLFIVGVAYRR